jgi:hypothetical protein
MCVADGFFLNEGGDLLHKFLLTPHQHATLDPAHPSRAPPQGDLSL